MSTVLNIPSPTAKEVEKYLKKWGSLENYALQERSLDKLFLGDFKANDNIENILIKSSVLNDFYSTNIFSIFPVAKHILNLNIDDRLNSCDESLVNDIAKVNINGKQKNFYSFATKYCSHHKPICFPIYDYYVEKVLVYFNKRDKFTKFKMKDLKEYHKFKKVLEDFQDHYEIKQFNLKDIDRYLWQLGKEFFRKKY